MALLTASELTVCRQRLAAYTAAVGHTKGQANAAVQAVIDLLEQGSTQTAVGSAIETVAPGKFNAAAKRLIFVVAVIALAKKEGVL